VAATLNDEIRRLQLSALNPIEKAMVPPAPDQCASRFGSAGVGAFKARTSCSTYSATSLNQRLASILSCDAAQPPQRDSALDMS
jgi:hypothetical protein